MHFPAVACCAAFCAAYGAGVMVVRRLGIVLQAHLRVVPHPQRDNGNGKRFEKLGLPTRPQVVEQSRPRLQAGRYAKCEAAANALAFRCLLVFEGNLTS